MAKWLGPKASAEAIHACDPAPRLDGLRSGLAARAAAARCHRSRDRRRHSGDHEGDHRARDVRPRVLLLQMTGHDHRRHVASALLRPHRLDHRRLPRHRPGDGRALRARRGDRGRQLPAQSRGRGRRPSTRSPGGGGTALADRGRPRERRRDRRDVRRGSAALRRRSTSSSPTRRRPRFARSLDTKPHHVERTFAITVSGFLRCVQEAVPLMEGRERRDRGGLGLRHAEDDPRPRHARRGQGGDGDAGPLPRRPSSRRSGMRVNARESRLRRYRLGALLRGTRLRAAGSRREWMPSIPARRIAAPEEIAAVITLSLLDRRELRLWPDARSSTAASLLDGRSRLSPRFWHLVL